MNTLQDFDNAILTFEKRNPALHVVTSIFNESQFSLEIGALGQPEVLAVLTFNECPSALSIELAFLAVAPNEALMLVAPSPFHQ